MTSTCTIRARGTGFTTDPDTGAVTPTEGATIYTGKCRVKPGGGASAGGAIESGGTEAFTYDVEVWIPFGSPKVPAGSIVTIDASPDAWAVGVRCEVAKAPPGEHLNRHTLYCREAT